VGSSAKRIVGEATKKKAKAAEARNVLGVFMGCGLQ
jgi:hypothetical protein